MALLRAEHIGHSQALARQQSHPSGFIKDFVLSHRFILSRGTVQALKNLAARSDLPVIQKQVAANLAELEELLDQGITSQKHLRQSIKSYDFVLTSLNKKYFAQLEDLLKEILPPFEIKAAFVAGEFKLTTTEERKLLFQEVIRGGGDPLQEITLYNGVLQYTFAHIKATDPITILDIERVVLANDAILPSGKSIEMVGIPAGSFTMGSQDCSTQQPIREVTLTRDFAMSKHEITRSQYLEFLHDTDQRVPKALLDESKHNHPITEVSWENAQAFCQWLSQKTGKHFRLPTEAEWEYAARGPKSKRYPWGNELERQHVTFSTTATSPVDKHDDASSPFGVMDLVGNVREWCQDGYGPYEASNSIDPRGPLYEVKERVTRGASHADTFSGFLTATQRFGFNPTTTMNDLGFRIVQTLINT